MLLCTVNIIDWPYNHEVVHQEAAKVKAFLLNICNYCKPQQHIKAESFINRIVDLFVCVLTSIIDKTDITHCSSRIIASILQECQKAVLRFGPFYLGYSTTMCPTCYLLVKYLTMLLLWLSKKRAAVWSSAFWLQTHWRLARCCCVTPTLAKKERKEKKSWWPFMQRQFLLTAVLVFWSQSILTVF